VNTTASPAASPPLLDPDHAAFVQSAVSVIVASSGEAGANLVRGTGCRVSPDRRRVTVFVAATQSGALLADLQANSRIAVVFSQPSSHRTLQLKGHDAAFAAPVDDDLRVVALYRIGMVGELAQIGIAEPFVTTLLACAAADLLALTFTPAEAYVQTPGPRAGMPLGNAVP
jgi:hypothetical protein